MENKSIVLAQKHSEVIFEIRGNGEIVLRGKVIAVDKELVSMYINSVMDLRDK